MVVGFEIEPRSTLDQQRLRDATAQVEQVIADLAKAKFLFLDWIPASRANPPGAPRLELRLVDGPRGACDPPAVRASFRAQKDGVEAWSYPAELELSELCDLGAPEMTAVELVDRVRKLTHHVMADVAAMEQLSAKFLSEIVLARELAPDFEIQKLYLPLKGLKAKPESEIEVRFANRSSRILSVYPGDVEGDRTQLFIGKFNCDDQIVSAADDAVPRRGWHPRLQELLALCREPFVYMKLYKPNPLEVDAGVVTELDEGGTP
ncbi:MAG TPA: hypothetical protein VMV46_10505 [Thermoanaerobaculia bacterium]|nr:hypothetical protein [Thermoanaerobaculia bacterium]